MRALCVCHYGHSRSVALVRRLHHRGIEAIAAGAHTAGWVGLKVLSEWASHIFVMEPQFIEQIPYEERDKVIVIDVGPDKWSNPYNPELLALVDSLYERWANTITTPPPEIKAQLPQGPIVYNAIMARSNQLNNIPDPRNN